VVTAAPAQEKPEPRLLTPGPASPRPLLLEQADALAALVSMAVEREAQYARLSATAPHPGWVLAEAAEAASLAATAVWRALYGLVDHADGPSGGER